MFEGTYVARLDPFRKEILNADAGITLLDFCRRPGSTLNPMSKEKQNRNYIKKETCLLDI